MANNHELLANKLWAIMWSLGVLNYLIHDNGLLSICLILCGIGVYKII